MDILNKNVTHKSAYGYLSENTLYLLDSGPENHDERYCENVEFVITQDNNLHITADFFMLGFDFNEITGDDLESVDERSIETRKSWFGLGKSYQYVMGWFFLKQRDHKQITLSNWKLIDKRE